MKNTIIKSINIVLLFSLPIFILAIIMDIIKISTMDYLLDLTMIAGAVLVLLYLKFQGISFKNNNPIYKVDYKLLGIIIMLRVCWSIFGQQLAYATLPYTPSEETNMDLLSALSAIILSPITEEITFRYGIINIGKKFKRPVLAVFLSIILFVIAHFPNLPVAVILTGSAFLYAFVYYKTGNILYSAIAHSVNNLLSVMTYIIPQMEKMYFVNNVNELINPYFVISFLIFVFSVVLFIRYKHNAD